MRSISPGGVRHPDTTPALAQSLAEEYPTTRWVVVAAAMTDKDLESMWPPVAPRLLAVVTTQVDSPRARSAADLGARLEPLIGTTPVTVVADPVDALDGGPDGLDAVRRLLGDVPRLLRP